MIPGTMGDRAAGLQDRNQGPPMLGLLCRIHWFHALMYHVAADVVSGGGGVKRQGSCDWPLALARCRERGEQLG